MKIQQMAFMILAVFLFFVLVGLFFLAIQFRDINKNADRMQTEQAISSLKVIADMAELSYDSTDTLTIDEDKLKIMSTKFSEKYKNFWPVASIKIYIIYPSFNKTIKCPETNCNYYEILDNGQKNIKEYSTFISICSKINNFGVYDKCGIGKIVVGVKINEK